MTDRPLPLERLPGRYAVCRLEPGAALPAWLPARGDLVSVTRTRRELSIIAPDDSVPDGVDAERGFAAIRIAATLDFDLVGILARLTTALAVANIPVFAISTYETDVLLVKEDRVDESMQALAEIAEKPGTVTGFGEDPP